MPIIRVHEADDPRLADFSALTNPGLLTARGLVLVEGRLVVERLLRESTLEPGSLLLTEPALSALTPALEVALGRRPDLPVWVVPLAVMEPLTGFNIHRGCLATARRPAPKSLTDMLSSGLRRFLILEGVSNPDNVGGLFRTSRAFGVEAIVLGPGCGDPLYRKAVRVSCGAALVMPFVDAEGWPECLGSFGRHDVTLVALTPQESAEPIERVASRRARGAPVAVMVGAEGTGLSARALEIADHRVRIAIDPRADSLNVTVAAAIALHLLA